MLLSLSLTGAHAPDLGWLLYKNPTRAQKFELSFGNAYVFYTENSAERATACLLLDINPLDLVKGKSDNHTGLFDYVNDRPYVCSSFMSSAISRVFGSAMSGKCDTKQDVADMALPFEVTLTSLPARGKQDWIEKIFAPLGYTASFESSLLDDSFPQWGTSPYIDLTLKGTVRLRDLLRHLYVLIPVFDMQKHYWMGTSEVEKLLRNGEGWLESHPEKNFITGRYFRRNKQMAKEALERLDALVVSETESEEETDENGEVIVQAEKVVRLNDARMEAVLNAIKQSGAKNIVDMGCGSGQLLRLLIKEGGFTRLAGMDVSPAALDKAEHKLRLDRMPDAQKKRISLFHGSLLYKDARLSGYDAACIIEVVEHFDKPRLETFARVVFGEAQPATVILTTPNREYNSHYEGMPENGLRHYDHRFEFSRQEFQDWANGVAERFQYTVAFSSIGEEDATDGAPCQMGVFTKCA